MDSTAPVGSSFDGWRFLARGDDADAEDECDHRDGHVDGERRAPPEVLDEPAAEDQAECAAAAGDAGPDADRLGPFVGGEAVDEDAQRGRHDQRAADAHHRTSGDHLRRRVGDERGVRRGDTEHDDARLHEALAAESVAQGAGGEEHAGEDQRVGVDHPLLLAVGEAECLGHLRQRHVQRRVADDDDQQAGAQHPEDHPPAPVDVGWDLGDVGFDVGLARVHAGFAHGGAPLSVLST